jgi:hypothetical protein
LYFLLDIETEFCYPFSVYDVFPFDFSETRRKEVNGNEEMGEHLYGIGDFSGVFFRVCERSERRED